MTIYLDIVFLENILMNYLILYATGFIQKKKMKSIRLLIASTIGAVYAIITYLGLIPIYSELFMKVILSMILVYIAYENQTIKSGLKNLLLFYLTSFVIGGCALAMLYMISPENIIFNNGVLVGTYPMKVTLIAGIVGFTVIQVSFSINKRQMKLKDLICDLEIGINGKSVMVKAYMDSGNMLKDPLSKKPVVIVEKSKIEEIVNLESIWNIGTKLDNDYNKDNVRNNINSVQSAERGDKDLKFRLIPFKSIGKQNGMLIGLKPEYIKVDYNGETVKTKDVIIGLYDKAINKQYSALIGLEILEGGTINENIRNVKQSV